MNKDGCLSETDTCREIILPYLKDSRWILDIGFGGSAICDRAITFDLERAYTNMGTDKQILRGDCHNLSMFCDGALCAIYGSHILEDFDYFTLSKVILPEWRRVLKTGGLLLVNCPDQQRFLSHCRKTGQSVNLNHKESDFSLKTFKDVLGESGAWSTVFEEPNHGPYSWLLVVNKV